MGDPKDFMITIPISRRRRKTFCSIFSSFLSLRRRQIMIQRTLTNLISDVTFWRNDVIRCCNKKKQPQLDFFRMNGNKTMHTKRP